MFLALDKGQKAKKQVQRKSGIILKGSTVPEAHTKVWAKFPFSSVLPQPLKTPNHHPSSLFSLQGFPTQKGFFSWGRSYGSSIPLAKSTDPPTATKTPPWQLGCLLRAFYMCLQMAGWLFLVLNPSLHNINLQPSPSFGPKMFSWRK